MRPTKSIRWRLLIWIALYLSLILVALDITADRLYFSSQVSQLDEELRRRVAVMSAALFAPGKPPGNGRGPGSQNDFGPPGPPPSGEPDVPPPDDLGNPGQNRLSATPPGKPAVDVSQISAAAKQLGQTGWEGFYFAAWAGPSTVPVKQSGNHPDDIPRPQLAMRDTATYTRTRDGAREMYHATERGDCILVGRNLAPEYAAAWRFAWLLAGGSLVLLAFGLGGAWVIIGRALRPVEKITVAARRIADGNLSERVSADEAESELGRLAEVLNATFARLETAFAQQKQFTADAAHELRTPIAVLISEAQLILSRERNVADYRESIAASLETAQQMRRLADTLLELSRFDAGQEKLRRQKVDLAVVVQDCVRLIQPLAAARRLKIHTDLSGVEIFADAQRINQVITNLLTNAVRYNRDDGEVFVAVRVENGSAVLSVADTGEGISPVDLPRIFERFYRADKSRSTGGNGLGLAIAKAIVEAHGGVISVQSPVGGGATFMVRLPLTEGGITK